MNETLSDALVGWRLWQVRAHADGYRLESFTAHHIAWPPRQRLAATCSQHGSAAPAAGHECGIYAFRSREQAEDLLRRYLGVRQRYGPDAELPPAPRPVRPLALGRVSLWGRVLARERGFRAQYAYPYDVVVLGGGEDIARELRRTYAIDATPQ